MLRAVMRRETLAEIHRLATLRRLSNSEMVGLIIEIGMQRLAEQKEEVA